MSFNWKNLPAIIACLALLSSCEYDYSYQVANLTGETMRLEICESHTPNRRDILTITPGKTVEIARHKGGGVKWDYVPGDKFKQSPDELLPLRSITEIYVGDRLMPDSLRCRKYWDFSSKKLHSRYKLSITKDLILTVNK